MNISSARYYANEAGQNVSVTIVVGGQEMSVPIRIGNRHYDEIARQVAAGTLTIADAE